MLIVEDDKVDTLLIRKALQHSSVPPPFDFVKDGREALRFLHDRQQALPSMILLDLNLPVMNGIEFLEKIKQIQAFRHIPVIIFSSSRDERDVRACFNLGAAGYLAKPTSRPEFLEKIRVIDTYWSLNELPTP